MAGWFRRSALSPEVFEAEAGRVRARLDQGDVVGAEQLSRSLLDRVEARNPEESAVWAEAHFLRCQVLLRAGDSNRALLHLRSAASLRPSSPKEMEQKLTYQMHLGDTLLRLGAIEEAVQFLRAALETRRELYGPLHTGFGNAAYSLAYVCLEHGKYREALEASRAAVTAFRRTDDQLYLSALALVLAAGKGVNPEADVFAEVEPAERKRLLLHLIRRGVPLIAPWIDLLWDTFGQLQREGMPPDSHEKCLRALANVAQALGRHADRSKTLEKLLLLYRETGRGAEDRASVLQDLALEYDGAGARLKALAVYEQAVQIAADAPAAIQARTRCNLAVFLSAQGRTQDAERAFREGLSLLDEPGGEEAGRLHAGLGIVLHHAQRWEEATRHLEQGVRLLPAEDPESPRAQAHLEWARKRMACDCGREKQAPVFTFQPQWKEMLVCSCSLGTFVLEMPMGIVSVYLPTESSWKSRAPLWAREHWKAVHSQLEAWCRDYGFPLYLDEAAGVYAR
jgi:tetratricopeptide (TPR) repeat protein